MTYMTEEMHAALFEKRAMYLIGDVEEECASRLIGAIKALNALSEDPITLYIDSAGGDSVADFWLMDAIGSSKAQIIGEVTTVAKSAAFEVLQACHLRRAHEHASLLFHAPAPELRIDSPTLQEDIKQNRADFEEVLKVFVARSKASEEQWRTWSREEHEFTAAEALEFGIIDEVLPSGWKKFRRE
jgi:ATP-dependent Clp protease protease subunit